MDIDFILRAVQAANVKYIDETWGNFRYLEGTKSFEDARSGRGMKRYDELLVTYRQKLPIILRLYLSLLIRLQYFTRHPQDFMPSLIKKITSILMSKK